MSLIAPPAKLPDHSEASPLPVPLSTKRHLLSAAPGRVPLLNSRHPACACKKPSFHPLSLLVLPNTSVQKAKYVEIGRKEDRGESIVDTYEADVEGGSISTSLAAPAG